MKTKQLIKGLLITSLVLPLTGCTSQALNPVEDFTIEFGNTISTNAEDYLEFDDDENEEDKAEILNNTKVEILEDTKVEETDYEPVGEYTVKLTYEDEEQEIKVTVSDTTKPVFKDFQESIEYTKDCKPENKDLVKMFKAEDLSKVTITVDDSAVNYTKTGEYKATVTATDESGNAEIKETSVKITEPTIKLNKTTLSMYVKASEVLTPTIKGKETTATWKSSNTGVATVSDSGKVTAKKAGTATVTATANGVSTTCKVTVKKAPTGSTTTTKTVTNKTTGKKETVTVVEKKTTNSNTNKTTTTNNNSNNTTKKATLSSQAITLINKEREKLGLDKLTYDSSMGNVALKRAVEISTDFSHDGLDKYYSPGRMGECCAFGYTSASSAVNCWMNSKAHRGILMGESATKIAVAYYGHYWVALIR